MVSGSGKDFEEVPAQVAEKRKAVYNRRKHFRAYEAFALIIRRYKMKSVLLLVTYTAKPGMREIFLRDVRDSGVLSAIRNEAGCLRYDYFLDAEDSDRILLVEKWESAEHQQIHQTQPHMKHLLEIKSLSIASTSVEQLTIE